MPRSAARSATCSTESGPATCADPPRERSCSAMFSIRIVQCAYLISHQSGFVKGKMRLPHRVFRYVMRFERAERRNKNFMVVFAPDIIQVVFTGLRPQMWD